MGVPDARRGDVAYFSALAAEMNGRAGPAALLAVLQARDLSRFVPSRLPASTAADLFANKLLGMEPHERWLHQCLSDRALYRGAGGAVRGLDCDLSEAWPEAWPSGRVPSALIGASYAAFHADHTPHTPRKALTGLVRAVKNFSPFRQKPPGGSLKCGVKRRAEDGSTRVQQVNAMEFIPLRDCRERFAAFFHTDVGVVWPDAE